MSKLFIQIIISLCFALLWTRPMLGLNLDSLLTAVTQIPENDKNRKARLYFDIAKAYIQQEAFQKSVDNFKKVLSLYDENQNAKERMEAVYYIGYCNQFLNNYDEAREYFFEYINGDSTLIDPKLKCSATRRVASSYTNLGDYELAYEYHLKALEISESIQDSAGVAKGLYEIGSVFFYQESYSQALQQYKKARIVAEAIRDKRTIYAALAAMGSTFEKMTMLEQALDYNLQSFELAEELEYKRGKAYALHNIGSVYSSMEKYSEAKDYYERSLEIKVELDDRWAQIGTLRSMASLHLQMGNPKQAINPVEEALEITRSIGSKTRMIELLDLYAQICAELGRHRRANYYLRSYIELRDSVLNEKTLHEMGNQKKRYEIKQKEDEIKLLKKTNEILEKEKEIDELYSYILYASASFMLIVLIMIISRYRVQKRSNALLSEKNEEINRKNDELQHVNELITQSNQLLEVKNEQIEVQNKKLEDSNEDLRNFASVASHDLKEPLRMINAYTNILNKKYNSLFDNNAREFMGYVIDGVTRMEALINNLLDYSRVSIRGGKENHKLVNSRDVVEIVKNNLRFPIMQRSAEVLIDNYEHFPLIRANQIQMVQLIQNLVSNALKFTGDKTPEIHIGFTTEGDYHTFYVKDNGIGISEENQQKVFDMLTRLHTKEEYEGTGIGLATVRKIVERHQGKIWVESEEGEGSTFFFTIPVIREDKLEPAMA